MEFSEQFTLLDIVVYIFIGSMYLAIFVLFWWHFTGDNLLAFLPDNVWVNSFIFVVVPYMLGIFFSVILFPWMLRLAVKKNIFTRKAKKQANDGTNDLRAAYLETDSDLAKNIKEKIWSKFSINYDEQSNESKRELFYVALRYIENYSQAKGGFEVERKNLFSNVYSGLFSFFVSAILLSIIGIAGNRYFSAGQIPSTTLWLFIAVSVVCLFILWHKFSRATRLWVSNVWRTFLIVENSNKSSASKNTRHGLKRTVLKRRSNS